MTVYCLIPVHNRLEATKAVLEDLAIQDYLHVHTLVIDDGSNDGTWEHLKQNYPYVEVLRGSGQLWWAGAIALGLSTVLPRMEKGDYVLLQNNDTHFEAGYIRKLVEISKKYGDAVVGSPLHDIEQRDTLFSLGPAIDYFKTQISDLINIEIAHPAVGGFESIETIETNALSGRGTLYPAKVLWKIGSVRHHLLPHYWADYELSARAHQAGARTLIALSAPVWTERAESGLKEEGGFLKTRFSRRSRLSVVGMLIFFSLAGPWYLRLTAIPRIVLIKIWLFLKRKLAPN